MIVLPLFASFIAGLAAASQAPLPSWVDQVRIRFYSNSRTLVADETFGVRLTIYLNHSPQTTGIRRAALNRVGMSPPVPPVFDGQPLAVPSISDSTSEGDPTMAADAEYEIESEMTKIPVPVSQEEIPDWRGKYELQLDLEDGTESIIPFELMQNMATTVLPTLLTPEGVAHAPITFTITDPIFKWNLSPTPELNPTDETTRISLRVRNHSFSGFYINEIFPGLDQVDFQPALIEDQQDNLAWLRIQESSPLPQDPRVVLVREPGVSTHFLVKLGSVR
jgi:hypothetical protein